MPTVILPFLRRDSPAPYPIAGVPQAQALRLRSKFKELIWKVQKR